MKTLTIDIPDSLETGDLELKVILAGELYEREKLSLGQAAELTGLSKRAFIEVMGKFGYSLFSKASQEHFADLENA